MAIMGRRAARATEMTHPGPAKVPGRKPANDFVVPSPSGLVPELGKLDAAEIAISDAVRNDRAELKVLELELKADDSPELHPEVAALLGDETSPKATKRKEIRELRHKIAVAEAAVIEIQKRRVALATEAGRAVTAAVRPEAERVVGNLVKALEQVDAAHQELGDLLLAVEAEGVSTGGFGPIKPHFLGDHREDLRRIRSYIKEVREAGYAG
ncbi:hypothetical protein [Mesorhizobium sp. YM1C-6-2]|uniref:hypothetical protein n=1 Tax=Mesorhizobium sp. YM1C-6-2 TaxID=1827501 RepID=UPI000EF20138|nr:hypothetical protein [Mesorhizobium sp. YM1C-6-2]RLP22176.1 hypothetical protein D8676_25475 [Mesorhizobium sp. YM1C-6-2]